VTMPCLAGSETAKSLLSARTNQELGIRLKLLEKVVRLEIDDHIKQNSAYYLAKIKKEETHNWSLPPFLFRENNLY